VTTGATDLSLTGRHAVKKHFRLGAAQPFVCQEASTLGKVNSVLVTCKVVEIGTYKSTVCQELDVVLPADLAHFESRSRVDQRELPSISMSA
jgi:hypothetical protein